MFENKIDDGDKIKIEEVNRNIYDFKNPDDYEYKITKGLNREIIEEISKKKRIKAIKEAENKANQIIGSTVNAVGYSDNTDPEVANNFTQALEDIHNMFPKLFENDLLVAYGTEAKSTQTFEGRKETWRKLIEEEPFKSRFADFGMTIDDIDVLINDSMLNNYRFNIFVRNI